MSTTALEKQVKNISVFAARIEVSDNSDEALTKSIQIANELGNSAGIIALGSVVLAGEIASILKVGKNK